MIDRQWRRNSFGMVMGMLILTLMLGGCPAKKTPPPPETAPPPKPARIAVVLGAGASKGFAHIGVLKVLEGQKVPVHMVVGTSAGSLVGSLYASGLDAFQLQDMAMKVEKKDVIDYTVPDNGFIKGEKLESFVNRTVRNTPMEKLPLRFFAVAADIASGEEAVFVSGNTGKAVRASCSVPGVFQPVKMSGRTFVDGGVVSPVAVDVARRNGADVVIAVDISGGIKGDIPASTMDTILQSVDIMYARIAQFQLMKADVVIRPDVKNIGSTEMEKRHQAILEGEKAAFAALPQIRTILDMLRQEQRL